jgi:nitrite reductase/ring-hydroxylating ferredoxin subunit
MSRVLSAGTAIARIDALRDGGASVVDLGGEEFPPVTVVLVRQGGAVHAFLNRCPHAGRPLNFGSGSPLTPDGELLQCHAHGALFEKHSGRCIAGPCVDDALRRLPVVVEQGEVRVAEAIDTSMLLRGPW